MRLWFPAGLVTVTLLLGCNSQRLEGEARLPEVTGQAVTGLPSEIGQWSPVMNWPLIPINTAVLPDGNVITWGGNEESAYYTSRKGKYQPVDVWNPASNTHASSPILNYFVFCSGMTLDANGRLMVVGGDLPPDGGVTMGMGSNALNIFDYKSRQWRTGAPMAHGRWYPTATTLAGGETLAIAGETEAGFGNANRVPEVYQASGTWRQLPGAERATAWYPWMFVVPDPAGRDANGRVFYAGPEPMMSYLDTGGAGGWDDVGERQDDNDPNTPNLFRQYGTAVMYDRGKILVVGGSGDTTPKTLPTNTAVTIDLSSRIPQVKSTYPMRYPRRQLNATLLPDGQVLVTGGTRAPGASEATMFVDAQGQACLGDTTGCTQVDAQVYAAELWNPGTGQWTELASMTKPRLYHSTAVLLPDGRVLSAGGGAGANTADQPNAEIFSPPYLFRRDVTRPVITKAPGQVGYGQSFAVSTPNAADIDRVTWIRLPSTTHAFNMSQRINFLPFTRTPGGLSITAPARGVDAPPGHYMLFLLNKGVPSVAKIVQIK